MKRYVIERDVPGIGRSNPMQLKEAATHVRWPRVEGIAPLSTLAARVPRLADLESAYRNLWKFYVFADTDDRALLARIGEIAASEFPGARNLYDPSQRS